MDDLRGENNRSANENGDLTITNEFTSVRVRKVHTRNGVRLEIRSLRLPHVIRLDALVLESLTWQSVLALGRSLETPFGPGEPEDGLIADDAPSQASRPNQKR